MVPLLLIFIPVFGALVSLLIKQSGAAKIWSLAISLAVLAVSIYGLYNKTANNFSAEWLPALGAKFSLSLDGMSLMLCLLTAIAFPLTFLATFGNDYAKPNAYYALMLLTQAGLMGVFLASDCLLFYFFWELALIPVYFLCSIWGGEKRIAVTFKFFIYTFIGSLLMLVGILYLYYISPEHSFSLQSFQHLHLSAQQQVIGFWLFFIAFAIKMPIFPLHTWQPDAYEQSPTSTTMILSGVMVKMGIFAVLRWLIPIFPMAANKYAFIIILFSVIGMVYASLIAIKQDDIKRLIAYSSIAHIGLMCAAIFSNKQIGIEGVMVQMFNHGINVMGLWVVADVIEKQLGTRKMSELGGLAQKQSSLAILLVVLAFANVALPLTNAFIGEFLMFNGLFRYNIWLAAIAGVSIILGAVYTLNMVQKVFYGNVSPAVEKANKLSSATFYSLSIIVIMILVFGVYPQPLIDLTKDTVQSLLAIK